MSDPAADHPEDPEQPATTWEAVRWDLVVLLLATAGFVVNYLSPDELSPALMLAFFAAMVWVAYRIHRKLQAFRNRS